MVHRSHPLLYLYLEGQFSCPIPTQHTQVGHKLLMPMTAHQFTGAQHGLTLLRHKHVKHYAASHWREKLSSNIGSQQPYPHPDCTAELQAEMHTYI